MQVATTCAPWRNPGADAPHGSDDEGAAQAQLERPSGGGSSSGESSAAAEARELERYKRAMAATGVAGVYLCWAVFTWCGGSLRRCVTLRDAEHAHPSPPLLSGSYSSTACSSTAS
jgi:hypothetical protein